MPQASQEIVDEYFKLFDLEDHNDMPGLVHLTNHPKIKHYRAVFYFSDEAMKDFDTKTDAAIAYLCDEWDYATDYLENFPSDKKHQHFS